MRTTRVGPVFAAILLGALLAGCASTPYVHVYVTDNCDCSPDMGRDPVTHIYAFPEDVLVWVNMSEDKVVKLTPGSGLFEDASYEIEPGHRAMIPILETATGEITVTMDCAEGGVAAPKVVVGDSP